MFPLKQKLLFLVIVLLACFFRFINVNWDGGYHLHPDERFLTMVANAMTVPPTFQAYMDPKVSTFNPANIGYPFYVYGMFPVTTVKLFAIATNNDSYDGITIAGRIASAVVDIFAVFFVFKIVQLLEERYKFASSIKLYAAFFYTISVLPIQLSHFFAVDTFLNTLTLASLYFAMRFWLKNSYTGFVLSAIMFGLAVGSKVSAVYMAPLIGVFILAGLFDIHSIKSLQISRLKKRLHMRYILFLSIQAISYALLAYYILRISNPYMFETANILNPKISTLFHQNIAQLQSWEAKDVWFPPAVQWINKAPVSFALFNLVIFGMGIPLFSFAVIGMYTILRQHRNIPLMSMSIFTLIYFLYQSIVPFKTMRYFIFLYPLLAMFAGYGFAQMLQKKRPLLLPLGLLACLVWPLLFLSIYLQPHSRVTASRWIYQNIPAGSTIAWEHWDDPLPLSFPNFYSQQYNLVELPIFNPDTPEKWEQINATLRKADYYIMSSNRGWGSIPTAPERYPLMTQFYKDLFAEKTSFTKLTEITSYPSLHYLGIPFTFNDDIAEESFTVYDHPKVLIYKNKYVGQ